MADSEASAPDFMDMAHQAANDGHIILVAAFTMCAVMIRSTDQICDAIHDARPDIGV